MESDLPGWARYLLGVCCHLCRGPARHLGYELSDIGDAPLRADLSGSEGSLGKDHPALRLDGEAHVVKRALGRHAGGGKDTDRFAA